MGIRVAKQQAASFAGARTGPRTARCTRFLRSNTHMSQSLTDFRAKERDCSQSTAGEAVMHEKGDKRDDDSPGGCMVIYLQALTSA